MSRYDDDDLDRALAALPLEEPPPHLHARIMAATVYRPAPALKGWEVWVIGTVLALAVWLTWLVFSAPHAAERVLAATTLAIENAGLTSEWTLLWLAIGGSAAWWVSQLSVPVPVRRDVRAR